jgi:hypothetical protein
MKQAMNEIVKVVERWADNENARHEDALLEILNIALSALTQSVKKGK